MTKLTIAGRITVFIISILVLYYSLTVIGVDNSDIVFILTVVIVALLIAFILMPADPATVTAKPRVGKRNSDIASAISLLISSEIKDAMFEVDGSITITYSNGIIQKYIPLQAIEFSAELKQRQEAFNLAVTSAAIVNIDKRLKDVERKVDRPQPVVVRP